MGVTDAGGIASIPPPIVFEAEGGQGGRRATIADTGTAGGGGTYPSPGGSPIIIGFGGGMITAPYPDFTFKVFADRNVTFTNTSLGTISEYSWYFGDGGYSSSRHTVHKYANSGVFAVSLTVKNAFYQRVITKSVTITPIILSIDFTYDTGGLAVWFHDTSTMAGNRLWDFGDSTFSTELNPYHLYSFPGSYTVTLTIDGVSKSYAVAVDYGIVLTWTDNSSTETGFNIERSPDGLTGWTIIDTTGTNVETFTVTKNLHDVDPLIMNYFRVSATSGDGDSGYTNIVSTICG